MKRILSAVLALAVSLPAWATTTWSQPTPITAYQSRVRIALAICTTGSEAAPTNTVTSSEGLPLVDVGAFTVMIETSGNTSAGSLYAYLHNPATGNWIRAPDLDVTVPAGVTSYAWPGFTVNAPVGRIAYVPQGLGSITVNVYVNASSFRR